MKRYLIGPIFRQLILGFFLLLSIYANAQTKKELIYKLKKAGEDSSKAVLYNALSKLCINETPIEARQYATKALLFSEKAKAKNSIATSYSNIGYSYLRENNYDTALLFFNKGIQVSAGIVYKKINSELLSRKAGTFYYKGMTDSSLFYFKRSLSQYQQLNDSNEIIKLLNNIGAINLRKGDLDEALSCFMKALKFDEKQKNDIYIALDCNNIGIILTDKKDFSSAMTYLERALKIRTEQHDSVGIMKTTNNIGNLYYIKKDFNKGIHFYTSALNIIDSTKNIREYAQATNNLGGCYSEIGNFTMAINYLRIALNNYKKLGDDSGIASSLGNIAGVYYNQSDFKKAIEYNLESYEKAVITGDIEFQKNARKILTQCYIKLNNSNEASNSFEKFILLQDSIYNENSNKQLSEIQVKYETTKKEDDNKLLQQQNELNQSKLDSRNKTIIVLLVGILVIVLLVLWRINILNLKKKQKELEVVQQLQKEKERISRDLHDNVGGQLSYVLYSLDGINDENKEKRTEITQSVNESVRTVISNLRETIWAINDEEISITNFSDKLKVYVRSMFRNTETKINYNEHINSSAQLNSLVGLNLYRICQEIINNAFKYANATELTISIVSDKKTTVTISDNGKGFELNELTSDSFGLSNIKSRANEVGIELSLNAKLGNGVTYTMIV